MNSRRRGFDSSSLFLASRLSFQAKHEHSVSSGAWLLSTSPPGWCRLPSAWCTRHKPIIDKSLRASFFFPLFTRFFFLSFFSSLRLLIFPFYPLVVLSLVRAEITRPPTANEPESDGSVVYSDQGFRPPPAAFDGMLVSDLWDFIHH